MVLSGLLVLFPQLRCHVWGISHSQTKPHSENQNPFFSSDLVRNSFLSFRDQSLCHCHVDVMLNLWIQPAADSWHPVLPIFRIGNLWCTQLWNRETRHAAIYAIMGDEIIILFQLVAAQTGCSFKSNLFGDPWAKLAPRCLACCVFD